MKTFAAFVVAVAVAAPLAAQPRGVPVAAPPAIALRPFGLIAGQQFTAKNTFNAIFGTPKGVFCGGGLDVVFHGDFLSISRLPASRRRASARSYPTARHLVSVFRSPPP